ncbi:unnamed protein product [Urochloa humidicola]
MAMAARAVHLAVIGLALLHHLAPATTAENHPPPPGALPVRRRAARPRRLHHGATGRHRGGTRSARRRLRRPQPPQLARLLRPPSRPGPASIDDPLRRLLAAQPRGLGSRVPGRGRRRRSTRALRSPSRWVRPQHPRRRRGARRHHASHREGAPPRRAAHSDDCYKLHHATCTVYPYDKKTGSVDRARPDPDMDLGAVCLHPLCHADSADRLLSALHAQRRGRGDNILYVYCAVRTLEGAPSIFPWRNTWRVHLPVADICYVELAHLGYREGYYIHCPVAEHRQT